MLSVALLLAGCAKDPIEGTEGDRTEITADAFFPGESVTEADTKAIIDGSTALTLSFARADETSAGTYGAYGAEFTGSRPAGTGSMALTFKPQQFYKPEGLNTRIIGWYPGGATAAGGASGNGYYDASAGTVNWIIDGQQDILSASAQEGSATSAMPDFVFNHRLAQIQVWPYAESAAVAAEWGAVKIIALQGQSDRCTLTLPQDGGTDAEFSAEGNAEFTVRNLPADNLPTTAKILGDPVMIAPTTDNTALNIIIGMADGKSLLVTVPERTYPAGSVTAVKLKFTPIEVKVEPTVTISDWATGGELNNYPKVMNAINTIVVCDDIGMAAPTEYPTHEAWTKTPAHAEGAWDANESGLNTYGEQFIVARSDAKSKDGSAVFMTWYEASGTTDATCNPNGYYACGEYSEASDQSDKGQWRLPTIRELKLICDKKLELTSANLPYFSDDAAYWSATEDSGGVWSMNIAYENILVGAAVNNFRVRCVRDL